MSTDETPIQQCADHYSTMGQVMINGVPAFALI